MDIVVRRGGLWNALNPEYRDRSILVEVTHADPQAQAHLQAGSADHDVSAASTSAARKRQQYARPGHVSFDERSHTLATFAVESFGRLGVEGSYFINQLAASVVGGRDGGSMSRRGVLKERLLQIVSVSTQVAISTRVSHFKLQLRDRQDEGVRGEGMIDPHQWRGDRVWTRSRNLEAIIIGYLVCNKKEGWNKDNKLGRSKISWN